MDQINISKARAVLEPLAAEAGFVVRMPLEVMGVPESFGVSIEFERDWRARSYLTKASFPIHPGMSETDIAERFKTAAFAIENGFTVVHRNKRVRLDDDAQPRELATVNAPEAESAA